MRFSTVGLKSANTQVSPVLDTDRPVCANRSHMLTRQIEGPREAAARPRCRVPHLQRQTRLLHRAMTQRLARGLLLASVLLPLAATGGPVRLASAQATTQIALPGGIHRLRIDRGTFLEASEVYVPAFKIEQAPTLTGTKTADLASSSLPNSLEWIVAGADPRFELGPNQLEILRPPYIAACDPKNVFVDIGLVFGTSSPNLRRVLDIRPDGGATDDDDTDCGHATDDDDTDDVAMPGYTPDDDTTGDDDTDCDTVDCGAENYDDLDADEIRSNLERYVLRSANPDVLARYPLVRRTVVRTSLPEETEWYTQASTTLMRTGRGAEFKILQRLPIGTKVRVRYVGDEWAEINIPTDRQQKSCRVYGWVKATFLAREAPTLSAMRDQGEAFASNKHWPEAVARYERAAALAPTDTRVLKRLLELYRLAGKNDEGDRLEVVLRRKAGEWEPLIVSKKSKEWIPEFLAQRPQLLPEAKGSIWDGPMGSSLQALIAPNNDFRISLGRWDKAEQQQDRGIRAAFAKKSNRVLSIFQRRAEWTRSGPNVLDTADQLAQEKSGQRPWIFLAVPKAIAKQLPASRMKVWSESVTKTDTPCDPDLSDFYVEKVMRVTLIDIDGDTNADLCGIDIQVDHHHGSALERWLLVVKERRWWIVTRLQHNI